MALEPQECYRIFIKTGLLPLSHSASDLRAHAPELGRAWVSSWSHQSLCIAFDEKQQTPHLTAVCQGTGAAGHKPKPHSGRGRAAGRDEASNGVEPDFASSELR